MAVFTLPTFTHLCDLYVVGNPPSSAAPDMANVPVQIYANPKNQGQFGIPVLRFDINRFIGSGVNWIDGSCAYVFALTSGQHYIYLLSGIMTCHIGFPNAYVMAEGVTVGLDGVTVAPNYWWDPT